MKPLRGVALLTDINDNGEPAMFEQTADNNSQHYINIYESFHIKASTDTYSYFGIWPHEPNNYPVWLHTSPLTPFAFYTVQNNDEGQNFVSITNYHYHNYLRPENSSLINTDDPEPIWYFYSC